MTTLVLASASPARRTTLRAAGLDPVVVVSGVDESQLVDLPPAELALQLAELKCAAVVTRDEVPGDALVAERHAHIVIYEYGGPAAHAGLMIEPIEGRAGGEGVGRGQLLVTHREREDHYRPLLLRWVFGEARADPAQCKKLERDGLRVVREGVAATEWVVVSGQTRVRPGLAVAPKREPIKLSRTEPAENGRLKQR